MLMLLHVCQIDQQAKGGSCQHLVNMRVMIGDMEAAALPHRTLGLDITGADKLDKGAGGKVGQVDARYAAAADYAHARAPGLALRGRSRPGPGCERRRGGRTQT